MSWYEDLEQKYIHLFEVDFEGKPVRGIEVSEGWAKITEELLKKFEWIRTNNTYVENPTFDKEKGFDMAGGNTPSIPGPNHEIKIFQIKQKFGDYVCYITVKGTDTARNQANEAISFIQGKACYTCEICGKVGDHQRTTSGWISILCDECKNKN